MVSDDFGNNDFFRDLDDDTKSASYSSSKARLKQIMNWITVQKLYEKKEQAASAVRAKETKVDINQLPDYMTYRKD